MSFGVEYISEQSDLPGFGPQGGRASDEVLRSRLAVLTHQAAALQVSRKKNWDGAPKAKNLHTLAISAR